MLNSQELLKKNAKTNLLPFDTLKDIPTKRYLNDKSGDRSGRHVNAQTLTKYLYNQGAQEINKNSDLLNIYHNLPPHEGKNGSHCSSNELQGMFVIYIALERLAPRAILNAYEKLGKETLMMTMYTDIQLPNGTQFALESALFSILYFYITKFNPNKFKNLAKNSAVTEIRHRDGELLILRDLMLFNENDTPLIDTFLDKTKQGELYRLINSYMPVMTDSKIVKFFKKPADGRATPSEVKPQLKADHCCVM